MSAFFIVAYLHIHTLHTYIGRVPMQSAFGKRLQSVSAYTVNKRCFNAKALTSIAAGNCKRRLKTAHWAETWHHYFWNDEFEITVVLDNRNVELKGYSVSMVGENFTV